MYDTYWRFAAERQNVFFRRLERTTPPWSEDSVLQAHKFTNAYRASDRVSQYLIRNVIYREDLPNEPTEVFFRILLFKIFNRIDTWDHLEETLDSIVHADYSVERYGNILTRAMAAGTRIYSAAYIMPSARSFGYERKHLNHLALLEQMMNDQLPFRLAEIGSMQEAFLRLRSYPSIGNFLAYQYATDLNYSALTDFSESEFVIAGPGAVDGIRKCFYDTGGLSDADVIRFMKNRQELEFERLGLPFRPLWGRPLQLIDCQNLFCEVGKYARVRHPEFRTASGRTRIKQKFTPTNAPLAYWYPPKWGINKAVEESIRVCRNA